MKLEKKYIYFFYHYMQEMRIIGIDKINDNDDDKPKQTK